MGEMSFWSVVRSVGGALLLVFATAAPTCGGDDDYPVPGGNQSCSQRDANLPYKCITPLMTEGYFCNFPDQAVGGVCYSCMLHETGQPTPSYRCYATLDDARNGICWEASSIIRCEID